MKKIYYVAAAFILLTTFCEARAAEKISLPKPEIEGGMPLQEAIHQRKSVRSYSSEPLTLKEAAQLLWAAGGATVDGVTGPTRAYPSAGGIYPLEIYLVAGNVEGLAPGVYKYDWKSHSLSVVMDGDLRDKLAGTAYGQKMISAAPATILVTALFEKTTAKYGDRGRNLFVPMDVGHLGQNVHLEAESLGLGTVMMAGFVPEDTAKVLKGIEGTPVYMMPVGHPER